MRIAHCQFESWCGEFDHNLQRFAEGLKKAEEERAAIVSFPECFLTGYPDNELEARRGAFAVDSEKMARVLDITSRHEPLVIVGFNEERDEDLYNTAAVAHRGHLLGTYSKCAAYLPFHKQGRSFPIFEHQGVKFGVLICADGGYIDPARILALKGARIIFAPHFNAIPPTGVLGHYTQVRADHTARAVENSVYFIRGNNVVLDPKKSGIRSQPERIGYGDSYIMDPLGEIIVRSRRQHEDFILADVDAAIEPAKAWGLTKSEWSYREFHAILTEAAADIPEAPP